jgi:DNA-binding MarR family transcriptional regulator
MTDVNEAPAVELFDRVWRRLRRELDTASDRAAPDLRSSQRRALSLVPPDGLRVSALAERAQMTPQSLGQLVEVLRHAGYLEVVADPADRRVRLIRPTQKGLATGAAIRRAVRGLEERWSAEIGEPGWQHLRQSLAQLAAGAPAPAG